MKRAAALSVASLAVLAAVAACSGATGDPIAPGDDASAPGPAVDGSTPPGEPPGAEEDAAADEDAAPAEDDAAIDGGGGDGGDGGSGACPLPRAWLDATEGTGYAMDGAVFTVANFPMSFGTTEVIKGMGQDETLLWLTKKSGAAFLKSEHLKVGGCVTSSAIVRCAADEYHVALTAGSPATVVAYLTQVHNAKFGYGTFDLVKLDPFSGAKLREARVPMPIGGAPPEVHATAAKATGYDVVVVGSAKGSFTGETGTGEYYRATYKGFLAPTCTPAAAAVAPDTFERAAAPYAL